MESNDDDPEMPGLVCGNNDMVKATTVIHGLRDAFLSVAGESTPMENFQDDSAVALQSLAVAAQPGESRLHFLHCRHQL